MNRKKGRDPEKEYFRFLEYCTFHKRFHTNSSAMWEYQKSRKPFDGESRSKISDQCRITIKNWFEERNKKVASAAPKVKDNE